MNIILKMPLVRQVSAGRHADWAADGRTDGRTGAVISAPGWSGWRAARTPVIESRQWPHVGDTCRALRDCFPFVTLRRCMSVDGLLDGISLCKVAVTYFSSKNIYVTAQIKFKKKKSQKAVDAQSHSFSFGTAKLDAFISSGRSISAGSQPTKRIKE